MSALTEVVQVTGLIRLLVVAGIVWAPAAFGGQVTVGDVSFLSLGNGTTQFYLDNFTGLTDGCSTPAGLPVCTDLLISGTLTYSYSDGSGVVNGTATLAFPIGPDAANGGNSYAPSNFQLPSTTMLSAFFSGSLTPADFQTDLGPFSSDGTVVSPDVVAGGGFALLSATTASTAVPEPSSAAIVMLGSLAFACRFRRGRRS
jgi:PEP-CTERM motif